MSRFLACAGFVSITLWFVLRADVVAGAARDLSLRCYATAGEVRAMPLRTALVDERSPCYIILIAADGISLVPISWVSSLTAPASWSQLFGIS